MKQVVEYGVIWDDGPYADQAPARCGDDRELAEAYAGLYPDLSSVILQRLTIVSDWYEVVPC
jgi:hypothetical protein